MNIPDSVDPQDPRAPWNTQTVEFEARIDFNIGDLQCYTCIKDTVDISNYDLLDSEEIEECCRQQAEEIFRCHLNGESVEGVYFLWANVLSWEKA